MDVEKIVKLIPELLAEYITVFFSTFRLSFTTAIGYEPTEFPVAPKVDVPAGRRAPVWQLNPKLLRFDTISILIGLLFQNATPNHLPITDLLSTTLLLIALWIIFSLAIHFACIRLGGKGTFWETISVILQIFGTVYVLSSIFAYFWIRGTQSVNPQGLPFPEVTTSPIAVLVIIQALALIVFLPLALNKIHLLYRGRSRKAVGTFLTLLALAVLFSLFSFLVITPNPLPIQPTPTPPEVGLCGSGQPISVTIPMGPGNFDYQFGYTFYNTNNSRELALNAIRSLYGDDNGLWVGYGDISNVGRGGVSFVGHDMGGYR